MQTTSKYAEVEKRDQAECKRHGPVISNPLKELDPPGNLCSHTQTTLQSGWGGEKSAWEEEVPIFLI